ncbi:6453_t:CDS:2, partial [Funneliformis geosporum]
MSKIHEYFKRKSKGYYCLWGSVNQEKARGSSSSLSVLGTYDLFGCLIFSLIRWDGKLSGNHDLQDDRPDYKEAKKERIQVKAGSSIFFSQSNIHWKFR